MHRALPGVVPGRPPAPERVRALRRMKLFAAALLLVAVAGFGIAVAYGDGTGGWGFLQTACEAALVGGLAELGPSASSAQVRIR